MAVYKPPALRPGGRIGVVAPAGCVDTDSLAKGVDALQGDGFEVELSPGVRGTKGYLAGDQRERAEDLSQFFKRRDIDAIFCARGGFGSIQLIPYLASDDSSWPAKIFVGYSDISVLLNWLLQTRGMVTFHGPMVAMDMARGLSPLSRHHFWATLTGAKKQWTIELSDSIRRGKAEAEMIGGCLSVLVTTLGTPYEVQTSGRLLFLEDIGEKPYRIERMLTHLRMAGKLDGLAGLVFGDFAHCEGEGGRDLRQIIGECFHDAPYPVVMGMPAGHGQENLALPFGVRMALDGDTSTLSLIESPVA